MVVGSLTGVFVATINNLIDVIRVNYQMGNFKFPYSLSFFYRGYSKSLIKGCLGGVLYFPLNDFLIKSLIVKF